MLLHVRARLVSTHCQQHELHAARLADACLIIRVIATQTRKCTARLRLHMGVFLVSTHSLQHEIYSFYVVARFPDAARRFVVVLRMIMMIVREEAAP